MTLGFKMEKFNSKSTSEKEKSFYEVMCKSSSRYLPEIIGKMPLFDLILIKFFLKYWV